MKKFFITLITLLALLFSSQVFASEANIGNVFKIYAYSYNPLTGIYEGETTGSAVYIGGDEIVTNAHVLIDEAGVPYENYEVCRTYSFRESPECFTVAELKHIDTEADLAYLTIDTLGFDLGLGVSWGIDLINIGDSVSILGYPGTGGDTITLSEGKISGYVDGFYKTDSDIDAGNSGGGAFNEAGSFVGIPTMIAQDAANIGYIIGVEDIFDFLDSAQNNPNFVSDTTEFRIYIDNYRSKKYLETNVQVPGLEIRNPGRYNYETYSYIASNLGIAEYYLKSKNSETYVEVANFQNLESNKQIVDTWDHLEDNETKKIIKRDLTLGGADLNLLAYIDLVTQDIEMYFLHESSSFSIFGNMSDTTPIIDALRMLISSTTFGQQEPAVSNLNYQGYVLTPQNNIFSSNEIGEGTLINHTEIGGQEIELTFQDAGAFIDFEEFESTYEDILTNYYRVGETDEDGHTLNKAELVQNAKGEIFIMAEYYRADVEVYSIILTKYGNPEGVSGIFTASSYTFADNYPNIKNDLITFFNTLEFMGGSPIQTNNPNSLMSVSEFFQ